ncbi:MAG: copper chaperone PCu(A)C [Hyphomicrobiales bacterium]|nr:MAG: copper chaperone PCu(A)C [Hyphomicrobiales bacterium]
MNPYRLAAVAALLALSTPSFAHNGLVHGGCAVGQTFSANGISVSGAFTRAMLPNAGAAGGYLSIDNAGAEADTLTGASSQAAAIVEVHQMKMEGDVMKMAAVEGGLEIPAGGSVALEPMGYHLMFMQIDVPFKEGDCVEVTLHFAKAGDVPVVLNIGSVAQKEPVMDHGDHGDHDMSDMSEMPSAE